MCDEGVVGPDNRYELAVHVVDFLLRRALDVHAIAAPQAEPVSTGLYL